MRLQRHISVASILAPLLLLGPALVASTLTPTEVNPHSPELKYWPPGMKPSEETIQELKRQHERRSLPQDSGPIAVRKMQPDELEKFYHYNDPFARSIPDYFSPGEEMSVVEAREAGSSDLFFEFQAPHYGASEQNLFKRQFSCPQNHYACDSINAPAYCCRVDEQCIKVNDTGMGNVGCCPNGQKCEGPLKGCNDDQVACNVNQGGGCCIQGYMCSPNGCVPDNSSGPTATPTVEGAQTTQACSDGSYACPSTLAGGCCAIGRACGVDLCPATETQTLPPAVPTDTCPTGFYSCAARFNGGCCRIGRDCAMTNCPARTSGATNMGDEAKTTPTSVYVVPAGSCQTGWHSCPPSYNGGCCPEGYDCGVTNCPANTLAGILPAETKRMPVATGSAVGVRVPGVGYVKEVVVVVGVVIGVNAMA